MQHSLDDTFGMGIGLIGTGLFIFLMFRMINKFRNKNTDNYIETTGTIVNAEKRRHNNGSNYYYTIEYKTSEGQKISTGLDHSTLFKRFEIGDQLVVYYNPSNPRWHYTPEGKEQGRLFFNIQKTAAVLFAFFGVIVLCTVDSYSDLYIVRSFKEFFEEESPESKSQTKIYKCFEDYIKQSEKNGVSLTVSECDSVNRSTNHKWLVLKNKFCFRSFSDNNIFLSHINKDSTFDGIYCYSFSSCADGSPYNKKQQSIFLILSTGEDYFVDDTFFSSLSIDSLGEFHLDSVINDQFYGYIISRSGTNSSSSIKNRVKIEYPGGKIIFESPE